MRNGFWILCKGCHHEAIEKNFSYEISVENNELVRKSEKCNDYLIIIMKRKNSSEIFENPSKKVKVNCEIIDICDKYYLISMEEYRIKRNESLQEKRDEEYDSEITIIEEENSEKERYEINEIGNEQIDAFLSKLPNTENNMIRLCVLLFVGKGLQIIVVKWRIFDYSSNTLPSNGN
ncbi:hypothetical protein RhiirA1_539022 [Rhizophagus irregularis]|uniref:Uncharacterized protein n=1 Tax=Rhizophagus irregularis TaxID=588596 RepID=A0A2N0REE0_9GLOM|nr:hypothetical protein RhiirA1_539022 [Rhizophagus irregularis]